MSTSLRRLTPVLVAALVLALVLGVGALLRGGDGGPAGSEDRSAGDAGDPPVLELSDLPLLDGQAVEPRWHLSGELPASGPGELTVHPVTGPDLAAAARVAEALGLTGEGRREGGATVWRTGRAMLRVAADGQWQYGDLDVGCVTRPTTGPDAPDTGPTCGRLRADDSAAGTGTADAAVGVRVLDATGIGPRRTVYAAGSSVTMIGEPSAAGARTAGLTTTVRITGRVVTGATGWLPQVGDGVSYPVVDAQTAWERLRHTLLPQTLIACPEPVAAGTDPLLCGGPAKVTGAQLGRSLQHAADGSAVLVPAWLFRVSGRAAGYPVVALPDRLLRGPSVAGGGTSGSPGTASDLPTTTVAPPTPIRGPGKDPVSPEPANPGSRFSGVRAVRPDELTVTFTGGVDDCYGYQVVAKETATRVRLSLTETVTSGKACIDLAQVYDRSVPLRSALAGRSVVDAESGAVLLKGSGG